MIKKVLLSLLFLPSVLFANTTVYTMPGCTGCEMMKQWLHDHNIQFEEKASSASGFPFAPVLIHNGKRIDGFDEQALEQEFK